jgi:hypothetical protein
MSSVRYMLIRNRDMTAKAHSLLSEVKHNMQHMAAFPAINGRSIISRSLCNPSDRPPKPRSMTAIQLSKSGPDLELNALSQLVHTSQTRLIGQAIHFLSAHDGPFKLKETVDGIIGDWEESMLSGDGGEEGWLAAVRAVDLGMAINRIRGLKVI